VGRIAARTPRPITMCNTLHVQRAARRARDRQLQNPHAALHTLNQ
jgi:hypothetical protein